MSEPKARRMVIGSVVTLERCLACEADRGRHRAALVPKGLKD